MGERAQAHTLEGIAAALLLLSSIVFALQTTAVTPLSASTSSQHIENQQAATTDGLLTAAAERGALKRAVLFWNDSKGGKFYGADDGRHFTNDGAVDNFTFGRMLLETFEPQGVAFNVYVSYRTPSGHNRLPLVYRGEPSDNAITETRLLTLYDDDVLYADPDGDGVTEPTTTSVTDSPYGPDVSPTGVFNVLRVEVVVWRM